MSNNQLEIAALKKKVAFWKKLAEADVGTKDIKLFETRDNLVFVFDNEKYETLPKNGETIDYYKDYLERSLLGYFNRLRELSELGESAE